ncbi:beta subunit of transcription initiation factor IIF [Chloropicon primus]|uniref:Beta subunit of transcription initiation factor IIF n=1 Tax=Chloropicon primus TaxID=1764295 RepID=A0A5B8MPD5_9CHLO|nr:beta subunit of transcription initiation factor IIF [Chloropicon primus]UPR01586.1 beta subunit of transcription initiation factor IIF [Chloropicon primus]|eukprot:QDZ22369.1 beta subunit of transcription initiation factor IIF [Chloropicon primus]
MEEEGGKRVERVRVDKSGRQLWLVKVPKSVDKVWRTTMEEAGDGEGIEVGEVTIIQSDQGQESTSAGQFKLDLSERPGSDRIPLHYTMIPSVSSGQELMCMHALAQDRGAASAGEATNPAIEGRVGQQFALQPKMGREYFAMSRQRSKQQAGVSGGVSKPRVISRVHLSDTSVVQMSKEAVPLPVSYVGGAKYKREHGRKQSDYKRVKMENKESLMNWLFELFQREPYWRFDAIQKTTNQPTRFLMDVLREVATKVLDGDHRGKWELKDKYRSS